MDVGIDCLLRLHRGLCSGGIPAIGAALLHRPGIQEVPGLGPHCACRGDILVFLPRGFFPTFHSWALRFVLFCFVEIGSHVTQAGLIFTMCLRQALNA